jgi:hypothetical protein
MFRLLILLTLLSHSLSAQPIQKLKEKVIDWVQDTVPEDSTQPRRNYFIIVPVPRYLPETRWGVVLAGNFVFRTHPDYKRTRPSSIRLSSTWTQNQQYIFKPTLELFTPENKWMIRSGFVWMRFPELYFGKGGSTPEDLGEMYTFDMSRFFGRVMKRWTDDLYAGAMFQYEHMFNMEYPVGSWFERQPVTGGLGGRVSGIGLIAVWDNRKNIYFPIQGVFAQTSVQYHGNLTGSDFTFVQIVSDIRKYFPLRKGKDVWAFQLYGMLNPGDPPFRQMGLLGGEELGRGYYQGRYRDKHHVSVQTEYRLKVWKRMGLTGFAGTASVFQKSPIRAPWHAFYGIGIRGKLLRKENLNVRLDIGIGEGLRNYYFTMDEAF